MDNICETCRYRHGIKGDNDESPCELCEFGKTFWIRGPYRPVPWILRPLYWLLDKGVEWMMGKNKP